MMMMMMMNKMLMPAIQMIIEDEDGEVFILPGLEDGMQETEEEERRFVGLEPWPSLQFCVCVRERRLCVSL